MNDSPELMQNGDPLALYRRSVDRMLLPLISAGKGEQYNSFSQRARTFFTKCAVVGYSQDELSHNISGLNFSDCIKKAMEKVSFEKLDVSDRKLIGQRIATLAQMKEIDVFNLYRTFGLAENGSVFSKLEKVLQGQLPDEMRTALAISSY